MPNSNDNNNEFVEGLIKGVATIGVGVATWLAARTIYENKEKIQDNVNSFSGLPVMILGPSGTGKSTFISWLQSEFSDRTAIEQTRPEGKQVPEFTTKIADRSVKLYIGTDLPGENQDGIWKTKFEKQSPEGIALLISHGDPNIDESENKIAWERTLDLLRLNQHLTEKVKAFHIFVNKMDLWSPDGVNREKAFQDILSKYNKQKNITETLTKRFNIDYSEHHMSLETGEDVAMASKNFLDSILIRKRII